MHSNLFWNDSGRFNDSLQTLNLDRMASRSHGRAELLIPVI